MNDTFRQLKELTGIKESDIARKFNVSRQYINQLKRGTSLTYKLAFYNILSTMAQEEIDRLEEKIEKIRRFLLTLRISTKNESQTKEVSHE